MSSTRKTIFSSEPAIISSVPVDPTKSLAQNPRNYDAGSERDGGNTPITPAELRRAVPVMSIGAGFQILLAVSGLYYRVAPDPPLRPDRDRHR